MPGSGPDDLHEEPDIHNNPPTDHLTGQGIDEAFSLFKTYLETRLEQKGKELEEKQKIDLTAEKFKFKSNQKQFVFNAELEELVEKNQRSKRPEGRQQGGTFNGPSQIAVAQETEACQTHRLEVKPAGTAVQEYESQDIASADDEDDKKTRNARAAANRERKQKERERQQQSNKKRCTTPNLGTPDHHLFRGIYIAIVFTLYSSCYSLRCFVFSRVILAPRELPIHLTVAVVLCKFL